MINLFYTHVNDKAKENCMAVLDSGFLNQGKVVEQLESVFSQYFYTPNPVTMNSCTSALHVALEICNVRGQEVILPAQTFIATGLAVLMAGGIPVFADIYNDGNINLEDVVKKITSKTKAIIGVDWAGNDCELNKLAKLDSGIPLIIDAAHSFFRLDYQNIDFTCYSFQSIKNLTCGDGGLLCCAKKEHADIANELKWFGIDKYRMKRTPYGDRDFPITKLGYKYNMNDIDASLLLGNLVDIRERLYKRKLNYNKYVSNIKNEHVNIIVHNTYSKNWLCNLLVSDQLSFINHMRSAGIESSVVDRRIDTHPIFNQTNYLPVQELYDKNQINIPVHENLTSKEVDHIITTVNSWHP
jgi:perosamine synthetase